MNPTPEQLKQWEEDFDFERLAGRLDFDVRTISGLTEDEFAKLRKQGFKITSNLKFLILRKPITLEEYLRLKMKSPH